MITSDDFLKNLEINEREKYELERNLIYNEENINNYDIRNKIAKQYNNYLSFEYSNYDNQIIKDKYYINLQDTSLYNYFTINDSSFYKKTILDWLLKITILILILLIIYYIFKFLDNSSLLIIKKLYKNNLVGKIVFKEK